MTRRRAAHDPAAERSLCAALLVRPAGIPSIATHITPADFYDPTLAHVYAAICETAAAGQPVDGITVAARLNGHGDTVDLDALIVDAPYISNPGAYATIIADCAHRRRAQSAALELDTALQDPSTDLTRLLAAHLATIETIGRQTTHTTSWQPLDLTDALAGGEADRPTLLARTDGACLLYPGKVHAFNGESESLKSWLALYAVAQTLADDHTALYVDFEDSPTSIVARLLALGVPPLAIHERFIYMRPDEPIHTAGATLDVILETRRPTIAVVDGVTEAMALHGLDLRDNLDYAHFHAAVPKRLASCGAAVATIDHVTKSKEDRGRFAIGAQHKLAAIDGAAYAVEALTPFGKGRTGTAQITVAKDRPGGVREHAAYGKVAGLLTLTSDRTTGTIKAEITPIRTADTGTGPFRPTKIMELVSRAIETTPGLTKNSVKAAIKKGDDKTKILALELLILEGHVVVEPGKNRAQLHRSRTPYREPPPEDKSE